MNLFSHWGVNEIVAVTSAALALASFAFNWAVVRRQGALQFESLKAQLDAEVMHWANEAIDCVSQAIGLARGVGAYEPDDLRRRVIETSQKLSGLADRGRLFFPNEAPEARGAEKEAAFQGYRPAILDAVIFAHYQLDRIEADNKTLDAAACEFLVRCRRLLVSEVQGSIDPRRRGRMLRQLASGHAIGGRTNFRQASELGEELRARYPDLGVGARGADWIAKREAEARRR